LGIFYIFEFFYSEGLHNEEEKYIPAEISYGNLALREVPKKGQGVLFAGLGVTGLIVVIRFRKKGKKLNP